MTNGFTQLEVMTHAFSNGKLKNDEFQKQFNEDLTDLT
jgi:hypothetical protein